MGNNIGSRVQGSREFEKRLEERKGAWVVGDAPSSFSSMTHQTVETFAVSGRCSSHLLPLGEGKRQTLEPRDASDLPHEMQQRQTHRSRVA